MSHPIATYSFFPWLRQGIANRITAADLDPAVRLRATVPVQLELSVEGPGGLVVEPINRNVELYGPGDIVGVEGRAIFKVEPRNWITNFETNYLPYIEFYDEDFPWRYTPAAPDGSKTRLRPWLALVVLREDEALSEFVDGQNLLGKPLPFIQVADPNLFPPADQLWAWAHVHVNRSLADPIVTSDMSAVMPAFQAVLNENPDLAYSRIVCPRKLEENTGYHAFLIPVFESGRLAGLGLDPANAPNATHSAWAGYTDRPEPDRYPYYHRWYFRTGTVGDFEYLVRLLEPKPVDKRVGTRDMDVQQPGSNLPGVPNPLLGGVLKLGGALRVPLESMSEEDQNEVERYENWDQPYPQPFQSALASLINLSDDYSSQSAEGANQHSGLGDEVENDPDPLITPPLYGRWHSLTQRLLVDADGNSISPNDNWVHELNLDPRFRVPAGFGTRVVQEKQEEYMNAAWEQIGEVLEANRRIRAAQLAKEISWVWYDRHLRPLRSANPEKAMLLMAPVQKRVIASGATVFYQMTASRLQTASVSAPLRRIARPGGRLVRALPFTDVVRADNLLSRINGGETSAAPPKATPPGALTVNKAVKHGFPKGVPTKSSCSPAETESIGNPKPGSDFEDQQTPESVGKLPRSPDFKVTEPGDRIVPKSGETDSVEALRFKTGLLDLNTLVLASRKNGEAPVRTTLDLTVLVDATFSAVNPDHTIPRRTMQGISLPPRIVEAIGEDFREVMAYPEIDLPMYKPLSDLSSELFLPNINLIAPNSITLLETNQRFIEAYLVGLNHEFARELLWREYPTDMRGSYFRQFWDVSTFLSTQNLDPEALKEKLRDIPPIHHWERDSKLGDHDHREAGGDKEEEVVLVIRGELLKKYPTAVIYAHKAEWQLKSDGSVDKTKERRPVALTPAEEDAPPLTKLKTPLYQAKVEPDIYFFGFDLKVEEARGDTSETPDKNKPGWFFVIKERPGEPRFGLDLEREGDLNLWNDLSWQDVLPGAPGAHITIDQSFSLTPPAPSPDAEAAARALQHLEDKNVRWDPSTNAADLAYILYQVPVLVAVHASEMLPK